MRKLSSRYPLWLCDIWGVVHNGVRHFPAAVDALARHRGNGGTVILVTNAPRPAAGVERQLASLSVPAGSHDAVVTSGDVTHALIAQHAGGIVHHIGPDRDLAVFEGTGVKRGALKDAEAVVCTGLFDDETETPDDYAAQFADMHVRKLTMICANPDKVVRRGDHLIYCSGALAERYSAMGGVVQMAGKPYAPIYDLALDMAAKIRGAPIERDSVLAIGDGPETDIKGAADYGIAAVVIAGGIADRRHSPDEVEAHVREVVPHALIETTLKELRWADD
jgi:HAD superfamily hydrolase (TIGR01459 family)